MSSRAVLIPLVALIIGALGVLAFEDPAPAPLGRADTDLSAALLALTRSQERTAEALERLGERLGERLAMPSPSARAAAGSTRAVSSMPELIASLDALRRTFAEESRRTRETLRAAPAIGGERLTDVRDRRAEPDWNNLADVRAAWRTDEAATKRTQYFQTARDVLASYGPPMAVYNHENSMLLHYQREEQGPSWYFRLSDGIVVDFWLDDVEDE